MNYGAGWFSFTTLGASNLIGTGTRLASVSSAGILGSIANSSNGQWLTLSAGMPTWASLPSFGYGSVTSVGLSLPSQFQITVSPITGSGTLTAAWAAQSAATVLAGPISGAAAAPTFRSLAATDLPSHSHAASDITSGTFSTALIPSLDAGKITSGTFSATLIPNLDTSKLTSGNLSIQRMPSGLNTCTQGDILYASTGDTWSRLSGNTLTTRKFLRQVGSSGMAAAPAWDTLAAGDLPTHSHAAGDITSGTFSATLIPYLDASKINTGNLNIGVMPTGLDSCAQGDIIYASGLNTWSRLGGNSSSTRRFLRQIGSSGLAAAPVWDTLQAGDIPSLAASIITSGTFDLARLGTGTGSSTNFLRGDGAWSPALITVYNSAGGSLGSVPSLKFIAGNHISLTFGNDATQVSVRIDYV